MVLLAGMRRTLNLQVDDERALLTYQKALGETLFMPPNVAGWPSGRDWIDDSSLLLCLQLPDLLFKNTDFAIRLKDDNNDVNPNSRGQEQLTKSAKAPVQLPMD